MIKRFLSLSVLLAMLWGCCSVEDTPATEEKTASYKVEHYQQNTNDDGYTLVEADSENKNGKTGENTSVQAKTYEGFTAKTVEQVKITADGKAVVKIYYDRNIITLTLDLDGGEGENEIIGKYGATVNVTAPTKSGYEFACWNPQLPETFPAESATYTAKWAKEGDYFITYNLNGGTNAESNPASYNVETATIKLKNATKTGYTFGGWYTDEAFTEESKVTQIEKGSIGAVTLYAKWTANTYTITYNLDGGNWIDGFTPVEKCEYCEKISLPTAENIEKTNYALIGWYDKNGNKVTQIASGAKEDATFTAKWGVTADKVEAAINALSGTGPHDITVIGAITSDTISSIKTALQNNSGTKVNLDFSDTTGLTSIGMSAFGDCSSLESIVIPDSVTSIGSRAFGDCSSLESIVIPDSVTSIGYGAFGDCSSLESIVIPDSVTSIGEWAFSDCSSLTSIVIPDSVTSIGEWAFRYCSSLTNFNVSTNNRYYSASDDGKILYNKDKTKLIAYPSATGNVIIPDSVTSIGEGAFDDCSSLTNVTIGNSVTSIGDSAFSNCSSLTRVTIPDSVTSIGSEAFYGCSSLMTVNYKGTQEQWEQISIGSGNGNRNLTNATIINYGYTGE